MGMPLDDWQHQSAVTLDPADVAAAARVIAAHVTDPADLAVVHEALGLTAYDGHGRSHSRGVGPAIRREGPR